MFTVWYRFKVIYRLRKKVNAEIKPLVCWYSVILVKCVYNNNNKTKRNTGLLCNIVITLLWIMRAF